MEAAALPVLVSCSSLCRSSFVRETIYRLAGIVYRLRRSTFSIIRHNCFDRPLAFESDVFGLPQATGVAGNNNWISPLTGSDKIKLQDVNSDGFTDLQVFFGSADLRTLRHQLYALGSALNRNDIPLYMSFEYCSTTYVGISSPPDSCYTIAYDNALVFAPPL